LAALAALQEGGLIRHFAPITWRRAKLRRRGRSRRSFTLAEVPQQLRGTPMQVALAWLLCRSPNILLIRGTSSVGHLQENLAAASWHLPDKAGAVLNAISG
jgi:aryl-alcohol dehydrogenase-like predicted oxidoreductase